MVEALSAMASVFTDPYLIALIFATTILGVIIGVLPGLGATTGAAILLPFYINYGTCPSNSCSLNYLCFCNICRLNNSYFN